MKISIISDAHLGFGLGTEREGDAFAAFSEAVNKALVSDAILMAGDIFDSRTPPAEIFSRALEIFSRPVTAGRNGAKITEGIGKDVSAISPIARLGIPVVAIYGTHERRSRGLVNPIESLEKAGFLIKLHHSTLVLEKAGQKVAVSGLSGVPDQYAKTVLEEWNPKPVPGAFNILMVHQTFSEFIYAPDAVPVSILPKGFDLYVCGHIHERRQTELYGKPLLVAGSLVSTQLKPTGKGVWVKEEPKGIWEVEMHDGGAAIKWLLLENQREIYYGTFSSAEEAGEKIKELTSRAGFKPIARITLPEDADAGGLEMRFGERAVISVKKAKKKEQPQTVSIEQQKMSVQEMGRKILEENLKKAGLEPRLFVEFFELLAEGKTEEASALIDNRKPA
jgi:DNA repair exonuclease SbcCD nuclease subunit